MYKKIKVRHLCTNRGNNPAVHQIDVTTHLGTYFVSYGTTIAFLDNNNKLFLNAKYFNYSVITSNYLRQWKYDHGCNNVEPKYKDLQ